MDYTVCSISQKRQLVAGLLAVKGDPYMLPVAGTVQNGLRGIWPVEVVVDTWPKWQAIVVRLVHGDSLSSKNIRHVLYCKDIKSLETLLEKPGVIDWNTQFIVTACPLSWHGMLEGVAKRYGGVLSNGDGEGMIYNVWGDGFSFPDSQLDVKSVLPKGYTIGYLRPEHAELVVKNWKVATEEDINITRHNITHLPIMCIYNEKGDPITWNGCPAYGGMGIGFTHPEYQRRGLYNIITHLLNEKVAQMRGLTFGYIEESNIAATKNAEKTGTQTDSSKQVIFLKYQPKVLTAKL